MTKSKKLKMKYIRTPKEIWEDLSKEFDFTVDACASDKNHLVDKYWTKKTDALKQDWNGETVYCHPMYDIHIPKFIDKALSSNCLAVFLLPSSTNSTYFHQKLWDGEKHKPRPNIQIRFLHKPREPYGTLYGYKFLTDDNEEPKTGYLRPLMVVIINKKV